MNCADHVFDEESTNARVYELLIKDIITAAVQGFNGNLTCFVLIFGFCFGL